MSEKTHINAICTRMLTDRKFAQSILNIRKTTLEQYPLTDDTLNILLGIEAETKDDFIAAVGEMLGN